MTYNILTVKIEHGFDHLDADGSGRLNEDDHVLMGQRAAAELGYEAGPPEEARAVAAFVAIWNDLHRPHLPEGREDIDKAFTYLDRDGNGSLTPEEFANAVVEYWSSTDPGAPGNWWMGQPAYER